MEAIAQEQWEAEQDARAIGCIARGRALAPTEVERVERIEKRLRAKPKLKRWERRRLSLIEGFRAYLRTQEEACFGQANQETFDA